MPVEGPDPVVVLVEVAGPQPPAPVVPLPTVVPLPAVVPVLEPAVPLPDPVALPVCESLPVGGPSLTVRPPQASDQIQVDPRRRAIENCDRFRDVTVLPRRNRRASAVRGHLTTRAS
jgi:hypothetical protein